MQGFPPRRRRPATLVAVLLAALVAGCAGAPQAPEQAAELPTAAVVTVPPTDTPAPTATPAPTDTPVPTATTVPTPTPEPTPTPVPTPAAIDGTLAAELQTILDRLVADGTIPGAVLAVRIPGYAPWEGASGVVDRSSAQPMTPDTRVRIASITKIFTSVVVLQLYEEGRLDLEAPLSTWYPDLVPLAEQMTVRMLLNHTTGLHDYLENITMINRAYAAPDYRWLPGELAAFAGQQGALFTPGAPGAWDYSSTNFVILGMIVEAVTGNTLAQETRSRIFEPLGLSSTYFVPDEQVEGLYARGYTRGADTTNVSLSFAYATANIVSTAGDVRRFGDAVFGGELLKPETMEQMLAFQSGKGQYGMPALEYGLGVMRNQLPVGPGPDGAPRPADLTTVLGHTGGFGGFRSVLWHAPASGVTIALGENQGATDPNILATQVLDAVLRFRGE